jgi:lysophospholipase L1-like esterase
MSIAPGLGRATPDDWDDDGVLNASDNCPWTPNPGQEDRGGIVTAVGDGIGDACQCGDTDGDGQVDILDAAVYELYLAAQPPGLADAATCSVRGGRIDCDLHDMEGIRAELAAITPGVGQVCEAATGLPPLPANISASGDSITRGYLASCTCNQGFGCLLCPLLVGLEQPQFSWFDGGDASVNSVAERYGPIGADKSASVSGAEMVFDPIDGNFADQADAILAQSPLPDLVMVELGGNDLCSRGCIDPGNCNNEVYDDAEWTAGLRAGLDKLVAGLPLGSTVYLLGVPRVQDLRAAGLIKQADPDIDCESIWFDQDVCRIVTSGNLLNLEDWPTRFAGVSERQRRYNEILRDEALTYLTNPALNPRGIEVVADYVSEAVPSVGTTSFGAPEIDGFDCFHPSIAGQNLLAEKAWNANPRR